MGKIQVKKLQTFLGHSNSIYELKAYNEHQFFSAGSDGMVVKWDLKMPDEGEVVAKVEGSVFALALDTDNKHIFVGHNFEGVHKISLDTKKEVASVAHGNHQIFSIATFGDFVLVGLSNGELVVCNPELEVVTKLSYSKERIRNIHSFGDQLALSHSDNVLRILGSDFRVQHTLEGHKNSVFVSKYHPSGKYLASAGRDAQLKIWDAEAGYVERESIPAHLYTINDLVFSKSGRHFVTVSMDKAVKLWDAHNFKLLKVLDKDRHAGHGNSVNRALWMDYQDLLVTCSDDRTISVWEIADIE